MRERLADWLSRRLLVQRGESVLPPGGFAGQRWVGEDGYEVTAVSRGFAVDLYFGRKEMLVVSVPAWTALRLAWFLLWTWWFRATFCGLKLTLWRWAMASKLDTRRRKHLHRRAA